MPKEHRFLAVMLPQGNLIPPCTSVTVLLNSVLFIIIFTMDLRGTSWLCRSLRENPKRVAKGCHLSGAAALPRAGLLARI